MAQAEMQDAAVDAGIRSWMAPMIGAAGVAPKRLPAEMLGAEKRAWQEAEAAGRAAGLEAARADIDARTRRLDGVTKKLEQVLGALSRPLGSVDDAVHEQIALLATTLARALVRRELRVDPSQIIGIVRETVSLLPASARGVRVLLHPEDAQLVRERLSTTGPEQAWTIVDDPVLARGDCRVHTDYAQIDARLESRLNEVFSQLLGEDRVRPREEGTA